MNEVNIDKTKTALVVIDLQKGIVSRETAPHTSESIVGKAAALAEAFRQNNMPVFLVRVATSQDGKDALNHKNDAQISKRILPPDSSTIVPELGPQPSDFIITKIFPRIGLVRKTEEVLSSII